MFSFGALSKFKFSRCIFANLNKSMKLDSGDYRGVVKLVGDGNIPGVFESASKVGTSHPEQIKDFAKWSNNIGG